MIELSDGEKELWHEMLLNWCDLHIDTWTSHMRERNDPFYAPMLFLHTKSEKTFSHMLERPFKMSDLALDLPEMIKHNDKESEEEIIGALYFFHTNPKDQNPSDQYIVKQTTLRFHLFSKFQEEMLGHIALRVILYEGQNDKRNVLYIESLKEERYIDQSVNILLKNPFFLDI